MTTTQATRTPRSDGVVPRAKRPQTRNRGRIALGVFLIATLSFAFAVLYSNVGDRRSVLAVARNVRAGAVLTSADIVEVRISADPNLRPIAARDKAGIVGKVAGVDLVPGTLLTRRQLEAKAVVPPGRAVVGLALKAGQFPTELRIGDEVLVVLTAPPASSVSDSETVTVAGGRIRSIASTIDRTTATIVSLEIGTQDASVVAAAAAAGRVSLVRVGAAP